ncbi:MAG TPA: aspartate--tRNA(Asn) ligase [Acidimicrobiales bacterium]|nr:aspartate--tRNA(Asn) ligase [Acidimicrobiales bacterium]
MTDRTLVRDLPNKIGERVTLNGFVDVLRLQKKMQFVVLRDHTGAAQLIHMRAEGDDALGAVLEGLTVESAVRVTGEVVAAEQVKLGGLEVVLENVDILNLAETPLPMDDKSGLDTRMNWRFLDLRRPEHRRVFEVQTVLEEAMREVCVNEDFLELHSPKLMGAASESGAEVFKVEYFDTSAFLAQSPQFYKQMAIAAGFEKVFEVGPVFRAEPSFTSRHATEFTGVDAEIAWVESHEDVMQFEERWLRASITAVVERFPDLGIVVPEVPFPRVPMAEAREWLQRETEWKPGPGDKGDLDPAGERGIAELVHQRDGHEWVFLTEFPITARPFYHLRPDANPAVTNSYDLLWKGIEVTTGAQREHRYDILKRQAAELGIDVNEISFYADIFRFGCPPHGGFGLGLGRLLMVMLGLESIREATFLFRGPNRLTP